MFDELGIHNQFKESISRYRNHDPHLKRLKNFPLVYRSVLLAEPIFDNPGIYLITGGRQIGKTTFLKQYILELLTKKKIEPAAILFISGEIIDSHQILRRIINQFNDEMISRQYLFIDEVNYIPGWDKSIKYLADAGILDKMSVILTGSDSQVIRSAMKRFAGRRGAADKVDFVFSPLSFKEFICLKRKDLEPLCDELTANPITAEAADYEKIHGHLTGLLYEYLLHGGYLPAINDYNLKKGPASLPGKSSKNDRGKEKVGSFEKPLAGTGESISKGVINTYIHWIIGDILKYNKSEDYLFEILRGIKATYNTQVSWNNLSKFLSIEHHKTISDYCNILVNIHVLHIQEAVIEHKLVGAPKKNRKIYFRDPFIDHAVSSYLDPGLSIGSIKNKLKDNQFASSYVEAVTVDHCKRWSPTYYIKGNKGEVDIALVQANKLYPIEVKWSKNIRPEDLKQLQLYKNGLLLTPYPETKRIRNIIAVPLVRFLVHTSARHLIL